MAVMVTKQAYDFTANAVMPDNTINHHFNLNEYCKGKICVLFFYPLNFTFVCPSEILAFDRLRSEFEKEGALLVGVSIDSQFSHLAYKQRPINEGGIGQVGFPLVADLTKEISRNYDVLTSGGVALRGTFIIDESFIVRHQIVNDLPLGRSIDDALRIVRAIKFNQRYGEVCPANWTEGRPGMKPTQDGVAEYLKENYSK